jgi:hypothetical protein
MIMTWRHRILGALAFTLAAVQTPWASAQWGYPVGYGGYGWGGWGGGSTVQGSIARGMGAYAAGAGYYNQQTAVARSINADTVMRWNQYVYESQQEANRIHHQNLAIDRYNNIKYSGQIQKRLRDNPEPADIYRGDALNVARDEINDPRVYAKALQGAKATIGGETIRNIPFQYAAKAITVSIHQLTKEGPPAALMKPEFADDRATIKALGQEIRKQIAADKNPDPATVKKLLAAIHAGEEKADKILPANSRDRDEADKYLKALHGMVAMLETPAIDVILSGVEKRPDATLGELLSFMNAFNLRFGAASTPRQRQIYDSLYPKLVELRNEVAPALASSAPAQTSGAAAGDFFSGMSYEDLKKKAPAPPAPQAPR